LKKNNFLHKYKWGFIAFFGYIILAIVLTYPLIIRMFNYIPGAVGDVWLFVWNMWWYNKAITGLHTYPFYSYYQYYPQGVTLLFNNNILLDSLLSIPLQRIFGIVFTFNIFVLLSFILSGFGIYLLVKHLTNHRLSSFISGIIFAFSSWRFIKVFAGHICYYETQWIPFYILYLIKITNKPNKKDAIIAGIFLALSAFSDIYILLFNLSFTAVFLIYNLLFERKIVLNKKFGKFFGISLIVFFIITFPYLSLMIKDYFSNKFMQRSIEENIIYSADLLAFVTPTIFHPLFGERVNWMYNPDKGFSGNIFESSVFIGHFVLILSILSIIKIRKKMGLWIFSALIFFLLSLGPYLHIMGKMEFTENNIKVPLPYLYLLKIFPFIDVTRGPSRFAIMFVLSLSVICGYGLKYFLTSSSKIGKLIRFFLVFIITFLIVYESAIRPLPMLSTDTIFSESTVNFFKNLSNDKEDYAIFNVPPTRIADYLYLQVISNKRLVNGFVSRNPYESEKFLDVTPIISELRNPNAPKDVKDISEQNISDIGLSIFNFYNIKYLILYKGAYFNIPDILERHIVMLNKTLKSPPIYEDDYIIVYEIKKEMNLKPFLILYDGWGIRDFWWNGIERQDGIFFREIKGNATINLVNPTNASLNVNIGFSLKSRPDNKSISISLNDVFIQDFLIEPYWNNITIKNLTIKPGTNILKIKILPLECCINFKKIEMIKQ